MASRVFRHGGHVTTLRTSRKGGRLIGSPSKVLGCSIRSGMALSTPPSKTFLWWLTLAEVVAVLVVLWYLFWR